MKSRNIILWSAAVAMTVGITSSMAQEAANDPDGVPDIQDKPQETAASSGESQRVDRDYIVTRSSPEAGFQPVPLSGIVVYLDNRRSIKDSAATPPSRGAGIHLLDSLTMRYTDQLELKLKTKLGKPASFRDLEEIVDIIMGHYKSQNRPMTHVYIPQQDYGSVIRFAVIEGTIGKSYVLTQSELRGRDPATLSKREASFARGIEKGSWWTSWYQDPYRSEDLKASLEPRLAPLRGRALDTEELKEQMVAVNRSPWARLNRPVEHPFRDVEVVFTPPASDVLGETDLVFEIRDSRPLKFFAGVENNLTELLGDNRVFIGAAWYDAFLLGRDHQLGAQVFSAIDPDELLGVSASYSIPWEQRGHYTELFSAYAESSSEILAGGIPVDISGTNLLFGARHYYALPALYGATDFSQPLSRKDNPYEWADPKREAFGLHHEIGGGLDYKSTDNDLVFGGTSVAQNPADIVQVVLEYNARQTDPTGETNLNWQIFFSPGGITGDNTDAAFAPLRYLASEQYLYTKVKIEREQDLPYGCLARAVLTGQWADGNLMASEQVGLGGYGTVRGYKERIHRGDTGYFLNMELYTPTFRPCQNWFNLKFDDSLRFLTFFDIGTAESIDDNPADLLDDSQTLMSVGAGIRYEFDNDLRIRLDYGQQLKDPIPAANTEDGGAIHFSAVWTF